MCIRDRYGAYTETSLGFASAGSADVTNNEVAISGGSGVAAVSYTHLDVYKRQLSYGVLYNSDR